MRPDRQDSRRGSDYSVADDQMTSEDDPQEAAAAVAAAAPDDDDYFSPPVSRTEVNEVFQTWRNPSSTGQSSDDSGLGLTAGPSRKASTNNQQVRQKERKRCDEWRFFFF